MKLDRIDIRILHELQKNGRITNVELADLVHLSPSPCLQRVKKLQTEGFISGYSAQIDVARLGQTLTVFTEVTLKNHRQIDFARFQQAAEKVDEIIECHLISGGYDYLLKFVTGGIAPPCWPVAPVTRTLRWVVMGLLLLLSSPGEGRAATLARKRL